MMAEPSRQSAWGYSKPIDSSDDQRKDANNSHSKPYDFPPLGAIGPSKSASRKRATYTPQRTRFEAYPPRHEIIGQRQQMQNEANEFEFSLDKVHLDQIQQNEPMITAQQNGMSSVTVYDQTGKRVSSGPDIYSRYGKRYVKGKQKQATAKGVEVESSLEEDDMIMVKGVPEIQEIPPPLHLTKERVDLLIAESQRRRRASAAISRQNGVSRTLNPQVGDNDDPLLEQIVRAFSSLDGFTRAFAKDNGVQS